MVKKIKNIFSKITQVMGEIKTYIIVISFVIMVLTCISTYAKLPARMNAVETKIEEDIIEGIEDNRTSIDKLANIVNNYITTQARVDLERDKREALLLRYIEKTGE